jgi:predicted MFS family arabinose efflux permease
VATTLPIFLFVMPAGVLADILDRRRFLMAAQLVIMVAAFSLSGLTVTNLTTSWSLLGLTFALGVGTAMIAPTLQAVVFELVTEEDLPAAVALNSLAFNVSRAIGPALGGSVISLLGTPVVFLLNGFLALTVITVLYRWRRAPQPGRLPAEQFMPALRAGTRYVAQAPIMQAVLVRAVAFFTFASALWALLPLVARQELGLNATEYGLLLAFIGLGTVAGAVLLPRMRWVLSADASVVLATLLFALALFGLAAAPGLAWAAAAMALAGIGWITVLSSLAVGAQSASAGWVKARALAMYLMVFFGSMALGSMAWGFVAGMIGLNATLVVAAAGLIIASTSAIRFRLAAAGGLDLAPSMHWPAPQVAEEIAHDRGPIMVTVEYRIDPAQPQGFVKAMYALRRARRRTGALAWGLFEDAADRGRYIEYFIVESWLDHLRQHERVTVSDRRLQEAARAFHVGAEPPIVSHLVAPATQTPFSPTELGGPFAPSPPT